MIAEPIIAFFLLWDIRKILRMSTDVSGWDKKIKLTIFAVAGLFVIERSFTLNR